MTKPAPDNKPQGTYLMKKILVGAATAAALVAPGIASADTLGAVDFTYESTDYDAGSAFDGYSIGGAIATDVSNGLRLQVDGRTTMQDWSYDTYSHGYAAGHLSGDIAGFNVGGFAGIVNYYGDGGTLLGVQARNDWGNLSVDGSIAFTDFRDNDYDSTHYNIGGSYFFTPNFAVNAGYSINEINSGSGYDINAWSLGAAYQFANNVEVFGAWTNTNFEYNGAEYNQADSLSLGVRLNLNGGTLQDNTNGGLWNSARDVADVLSRW